MPETNFSLGKGTSLTFQSVIRYSFLPHLVVCLGLVTLWHCASSLPWPPPDISNQVVTLTFIFQPPFQLILVRWLIIFWSLLMTLCSQRWQKMDEVDKLYFLYKQCLIMGIPGSNGMCIDTKMRMHLEGWINVHIYISGDGKMPFLLPRHLKPGNWARHKGITKNVVDKVTN